MSKPLVVEQLSFSYDTPLLKDVSLNFGQGHLAGVLGPNGAGKSTLIKLLSRWYQPEQGQVYIQGHPLSSLTHRKLAQVLAVVEQQSNFASDITVRELVALGRLPHQGFMGGEAPNDTEQIDNALKTTGLTDFAERLLSTLSGGERQRARIAAALAQDTEILILDEPTSHLDIKHQIELMTLLKKLAKRGMTIVTVLHDINMAALYCDSLVLIKEGEVYAMGAVKDVVTAENIKATYECDAIVYPHPIYKVPQVSMLMQQEDTACV